jgi:hypothetical protein
MAIRWWGAALAVVLAGCGDDAETIGCRVGPQPCDEGEVCVEGECVPAADQEAAAPDADDFRVQVLPERNSLDATRNDPENKMLVRLRIQSDAGEPFTGKVLLRANPFAAATFEPTVVEIEGGLGGTRITGCDKREPSCPATFRIDIALDDYPTTVIGHSGAIRMNGVELDADPGTGSTGGGSTGGGTTGGPLPTPDSIKVQGAPSCPVNGWSVHFTTPEAGTVAKSGREVNLITGARGGLASRDLATEMDARVWMPPDTKTGTYGPDNPEFQIEVRLVERNIGRLCNAKSFALHRSTRQRDGHESPVIYISAFSDCIDEMGVSTGSVGACFSYAP